MRHTWKITMYRTKLNILVAGGAGYIGSVVTSLLIDRGHNVTVLDNLSKGHRAAVHPDARFIKGDIADRSAVAHATSEGIDIAMHFAAFIEVGESVIEPSIYYENNVIKTKHFLDHLRKFGVKGVVFSSTAAVYGNPETVPITETDMLLPVNPYGRTKLMIERILGDYGVAYGLKSVALRYFNAGGASGPCGEDHSPESHLIPRILEAVRNGDVLNVYGNTYDTRDGTCVRDYIHVEDLAEAHLLAAQYIADGGSSIALNLGTGNGYTVIEVIKAVERVVGHPVKYTIDEPRSGDSASLVASADMAKATLGWNGALLTLEDIVQSAWAWKCAHPNGYGERMNERDS